MGVTNGFVMVEDDGDKIVTEFSTKKIQSHRPPRRQPIRIAITVTPGMAVVGEICAGGREEQFPSHHLTGLWFQSDGGKAGPNIIHHVAAAHQHLIQRGTIRVDVGAQPWRIPHGVLRGLAQFPPGVALSSMPQDAKWPPIAVVVICRYCHGFPRKISPAVDIGRKIKPARGKMQLA
jgi:hypothetical protein